MHTNDVAENTLFFHVLLFECKQCSSPISAISTSNDKGVELLDRSFHLLSCSKCGWSGEMIGVEAKRHWAEEWKPSK